MAISIVELTRWLATLPEDSNVLIDDDGLGLSCEDSDAYLEVGGESTEECNSCNGPVKQDDPYYATPCGTYCAGCMETEHMKSCGICKSEFAN